ncbi:MAG: CoA-binding protein [Bacteroidales bacterium]|nr:CoA-binding protein [Bacteroidales bacterium]
MKKTLVVGASLKEDRYSNRAVKLLRRYKHPVEAYGLRTGKIVDVEIFTEKKNMVDIHTVTVYVNPDRQPELYDYILSLNPKRIIFNPGTENDEFAELAKKKGIVVEERCTLVMLNSGIF